MDEKNLTHDLKDAIWASLDDYLPPGCGGQQVGRNVVNHSFFQALLKHGHFREYHFFLANSAHQRLFRNGHGQFIDSIHASHKVKLYDRIELPRQIQAHDYMVFHQSDHVTYFNALCHLRNQIGRFPVTAFIHSLSYPRFMNAYLQTVHGGAAANDALICSSQSGKIAIRNCMHRIAMECDKASPPLQMHTIPYGVNGEQFVDMDRTRCRNRLGLDEKEVMGLCFTRFSDYDKMDLFPLLQAFQGISRGTPSRRMVLAGAVNSESYLNMLRLWVRALGIDEKVSFFTNVSERRKAALYRAADFFISLSDNPQETFGLTLLEAMASGLPLVVSDFDGYREIVPDEIGRRIRTTWSSFGELTMLSSLMDEATYHRYLGQSVCVDVDQLVDALEFFYSNVDRCRQMGKTARERFLKLYDYPVVIARLEDLWLKLKNSFHLKPDAFRPDPLIMNVFECFSHYVTQSLAPGMKVELTPFGRGLLDSETEYPLLPEMSGLIDQNEVKMTMIRATSPCRIEEIVNGPKGEDWRRRYMTLWMLKHGLLKLAAAAGEVKGKGPAPSSWPSLRAGTGLWLE